MDMQPESPLKGKVVLAVDDEPDVLETLEDELDMCILHKAGDYGTAYQYLTGYTYDVVILDIMGVNGFELLRISALKGFPTVMLTAHSLSAESLKTSIKLGAVSFLPKEMIHMIRFFLEDVVMERGKPAWRKLFNRLGDYFNRRFGSDWKDRDEFFRRFEEELRQNQVGAGERVES